MPIDNVPACRGNDAFETRSAVPDTGTNEAVIVNVAASVLETNAFGLTSEQIQARRERDYWRRVRKVMPVVGGSFRAAFDDPNGMTLGYAIDLPTLGKKYVYANGKWRKTESAANAYRYLFYPLTFGSQHTRDGNVDVGEWFDSLAELIQAVSQKLPAACLIRDGLHPLVPVTQWWRRAAADLETPPGETPGALVDVPRFVLPIDVDGLAMPPGLSWNDPGGVIRWLVETWLPVPFRGRSCVVQFSASAGLTNPNEINCHLFFRSTEPLGSGMYQKVLKRLRDQHPELDAQIGVGEQIIFTTAPVLVGGDDPIEERIGIYGGSEGDVVDLSEILVPIVAAVERSLRDRQERPPLAAVPGGETIDYSASWMEIARKRFGYGKPGRKGYNSPIFSLLMSAIAHGAEDTDEFREILRDFVWKWAERLGDLPAKESDIARYLDDATLDTAFANAYNRIHLDYVS